MSELEAMGTPANGERILEIDNNLIEDNPFNAGIKLTNIDSLADSLQTNGLIEPIVVYQKENGKYEIVSGHRRRYAWCGKLGHKTIKCRVVPYQVDPLIRFRQHAEANTETRNKDADYWCTEIKNARALLSDLYPKDGDIERVSRISRLLDKDGTKGLGVQSIRRYEAYDRLIPEMKELTKYGLSAFTLCTAGFKRLDKKQQLKLAKYVSDFYESHYDAGHKRYTVHITRDQFTSLVDRLARNEKLPITNQSRKQTPLANRILEASGNIERAMSHIKTDADKQNVKEAIRQVRNSLDEWEKKYLS